MDLKHFLIKALLELSVHLR